MHFVLNRIHPSPHAPCRGGGGGGGGGAGGQSLALNPSGLVPLALNPSGLVLIQLVLPFLESYEAAKRLL